MKTLYFEGAGWSKADSSMATVGNCRIRTAFHLDSGQAVYLELHCAALNKKLEHLGGYAPYVGFVSEAHYITDDKPNDDCNKHRVPFIHDKRYEYTHEGILNLVNKMGASFDQIVVLPDYGGYYALSDKIHQGGPEAYNYGDEYTPNWDVIKRADLIHDHFYKLEKGEGKKFPNFSLWVDSLDNTKLHLLRHYNGHNKHWEIDASQEDWESTIKETKLGRYGC